MRPHLKVEMREEVRVAAVHFSEDGILVLEVADVPPHRKIFDKHLKEVIVVYSLLELVQLDGSKGRLAEETPLDVVVERQLVGAGLATVARQVLPNAVFVLFGTNSVRFDPAPARELESFFCVASASSGVVCDG